MSDDQILQNILTENEEQQSSSTLRAELKEWERSFAAANGGRKPGRDDIKNDTAISAKYKLYSRLRAQSSQANALSPVPAEEISQQRKRKRPSDTQEDVNGPPPPQFCSTPRKTSKHIPATPSRGALLPSATTTPLLANAHPSQLDPYDSPSTLRRLFSPSYHNNPHEYPHSSSSPLPLRAAIGPTPQRDGKALGLFDLLSASGGSHRSRDSAAASAATPSSRQRKGFNNRRGDNEGMQTPSRRKGGRANARNRDDKDGEKDYENFFASTRTPASSAKKFYLANFFATPPAYRYSTVIDGRTSSHDGDSSQQAGNNDAVNERRGSASNNPLGSDTPSFLRRRNLFSSSSRTNSQQHARGASGASLHDLSPIAVRMPQKLVGRGLSTIVQGLRDIQEERLDEELDVLREIEAEGAREDDIIINDSQVPLHHVEGDGGGEGKTFTTRQWKKKGQKRTTRRVIMRPVRAKAKATPEWPVAMTGDGDDGDGNGGSEDELAAISETQPQPQLQPPAEPGANKENENENKNEIPRGRRGGLFSASDKVDYTDNNGSELNHNDPYSDLDSDSNYEDDTAGPASPSHVKVRAEMKNQKFVLTSTANANAAKRKQAMTATAATQKRKAKTDTHANYRALKIRGKGSHARGGGRRFGRRR
ncbi:hypothetical protein EMPG_16436 [Blastomyces silverae]|uniref:DNA replication regulator SLD2 n=1 Tax=Blastomyces silverae TaxID=2060906 RepID=A0A0H1B9I4_9EURO|nr:hypothetical protein EMPG_16436 [Blastomyces silverae]